MVSRSHFKAEKALLEQLKLVDGAGGAGCRIPLATHRKLRSGWVMQGAGIGAGIEGGYDSASGKHRNCETKWFKAQGGEPYFTNAGMVGVISCSTGGSA